MPAPLLRIEGISKGFPGVQALNNVSLEVYRGECLGVVGENGAGKSTLMKILSGVFPMDSGRILWNGEPVSILSPRQAQELGIAIIYQEFNLMPNLTVAENVFIGREPNRATFVRWGELRRQTVALLTQLGINLPPDAIVRDLSVAEQQMVEIAKALSIQARLLIMDEPTSALTEMEVAALMRIIRGLQASGIAVIFISHRLEEILALCNRIVVLRDGQNAGALSAEEATADRLIRLMVGRNQADLFQKETTASGTDVVLEVRNLSRTGNLQDPAAIVLSRVSFQMRRGEILGLAGLVGSGRTELARALFGADPFDEGEILVNGQPVQMHSPQDAIAHGIGLVPEDRKAQGLILSMNVRENISLAYLRRLLRWGFVQGESERKLAAEYQAALQVRTPSLEQRVVNLSGGNQQKVVIAKWLALRPSVLIMDEPTRGIDVGAKAEVHQLMSRLAQQGVAILMISSELPEIIGLSDRILVMRRGTIAGELRRAQATEEAVMELATSVNAKRSAQG